MEKSIFTPVQDAILPEEELALINRHTLRELSAEEVFCFTLTLCDNEIDRDLERFDCEALNKLAELFDGKTGIADHSMKSEDQMARIYKTWVEEDPGRQTAAGEPYTCLKAKAYMPVTEENGEKIIQIKSGIKKETSVSCSVGTVRCSVCGSNRKTGECRHQKGHLYDGKVCHAILTDPTDAYEWSFVAVPAQRNAGVTKSFTHREANKTNCTENSYYAEDSVTLARSALEHLTATAERFRMGLINDVIRLGVLAVPSLTKSGLEEICEHLTDEQLDRLEKAFRQSAAEHFPVHPQLAGEAPRKTTNNNEFKI